MEDLQSSALPLGYVPDMNMIVTAPTGYVNHNLFLTMTTTMTIFASLLVISLFTLLGFFAGVSATAIYLGDLPTEDD